MIKAVIKVITPRRSIAISRDIIIQRIINQTNFKKMNIEMKKIEIETNHLSMIGKIKQPINLLLMIGKINVLVSVGKIAIVVIVTIQMININNTIDRIKDMTNPLSNKKRIPNLIKTNKF